MQLPIPMDATDKVSPRHNSATLDFFSLIVGAAARSSTVESVSGGR
jgi:hypothetical protein